MARRSAAAVARATSRSSAVGGDKTREAGVAAGPPAYTDGDGIRSAALNPILGRERVVALFEGLARKRGFMMPPDIRHGWIDGLQPGFVMREDDGLLQTTDVAVDAGRIAAIYIARNPARLAHLEMGGV